MSLSYGDYLAIKALLNEMEDRMTAREDAAWAQQATDIQSVKDGWAALQAQVADLQAQLAAAGVAQQAALDADSLEDAAKVEAGNAALESLTNAAPVAEPVPVDPNAPQA
jgi:hypothetical protein